MRRYAGTHLGTCATSAFLATFVVVCVCASKEVSLGISLGLGADLAALQRCDAACATTRERLLLVRRCSGLLCRLRHLALTTARQQAVIAQLLCSIVLHLVRRLHEHCTSVNLRRQAAQANKAYTLTETLDRRQRRSRRMASLCPLSNFAGLGQWWDK